jgi:hypothetical protein
MAVGLAQQLAAYCGMMTMITLMLDDADDDDFCNSEHKWHGNF